MTDIPDGWEATEYTHKHGMKVTGHANAFGVMQWSAALGDRKLVTCWGYERRFPTPSAAIAALEEAERGE